jgi:uncharacterized protein with FMN-binding domain
MFPKKGAIALITTVLALVLLFNFKTPDQPAIGSIASTGGSAIASPNSGGSSVAATPNTVGSGSVTTTPTSPIASPTADSANAQTVNGSVVGTEYGDVEVQITVVNGTVTAVSAVQLPSGGRSGRISSLAGPILASEALAAQSANIDTVSGATYTSEAYARSLQAALDQAGIAVAGVSG